MIKHLELTSDKWGSSVQISLANRPHHRTVLTIQPQSDGVPWKKKSQNGCVKQYSIKLLPKTALLTNLN